MNGEPVIELIRLLAPAGSLAIVFGILAYRSPQLVKELFAGVGSLLLTIQKVRREKEAHKSATHADRRNAPSRSSSE